MIKNAQIYIGVPHNRVRLSRKQLHDIAKDLGFEKTRLEDLQKEVQ